MRELREQKGESWVAEGMGKRKAGSRRRLRELAES